MDEMTQLNAALAGKTSAASVSLSMKAPGHGPRDFFRDFTVSADLAQMIKAQDGGMATPMPTVRRTTMRTSFLRVPALRTCHGVSVSGISLMVRSH